MESEAYPIYGFAYNQWAFPDWNPPNPARNVQKQVPDWPYRVRTEKTDKFIAICPETLERYLGS